MCLGVLVLYICFNCIMATMVATKHLYEPLMAMMMMTMLLFVQCYDFLFALYQSSEKVCVGVRGRESESLSCSISSHWEKSIHYLCM